MKKKPTKLQLLRAEVRRLVKEAEPYEAIIKTRQPTEAEAIEMNRLGDELTRTSKLLERIQRGQ